MSNQPEPFKQDNTYTAGLEPGSKSTWAHNWTPPVEISDSAPRAGGTVATTAAATSGSHVEVSYDTQTYSAVEEVRNESDTFCIGGHLRDNPLSSNEQVLMTSAPTRSGELVLHTTGRICVNAIKIINVFAMAQSNFITRIRRLGLAPITALLDGGTILTLVALNALFGPKMDPNAESVPETPLTTDSERMFRFLADQSLYIWYGIVASGAVLIWYGLTHGYNYPSGCRRAHKTGWEAGINEGSYLNSIPPRTTILVLRCLIPVLYLAAAAGYHFGLIKITVYSNGAIDQGILELSSLPTLAANTTFSGPWAIGLDRDVQDSYFVDDLDIDQGILDPPTSIIMVGVLDCRSVQDPLRLDVGSLLGREIVMVANLTDEKGSFNMTKDHGGWMRTYTSSRFWLGHGEVEIPTVVDYRIVEPGKVQLQWAQRGSWLDDDGPESTPVFRRVGFTIRYAVAIIAREIMHISEDECATAFDVDILSIDSNPPATELTNGSLPHIWNWTDIMLGSIDSDVSIGVTAFLRAVMAGWASPAPGRIRGPQIGLIADDDKPFGPEQAPGWEIPDVGRRGYPYYTGMRSDVYTGCNREAACIFLIMGTLAILVGLVRLQCGPFDVGADVGKAGYLALRGEEPTQDDECLVDTGCEDETE
ncbi:hypothetical protein B0J13DRAFT_677663 [Dactylonectria estremocensis]|uniref:Transmembrane protein n=1 Tax=Dactylonectria estremocensis TaxID=1079267 RepID=A0A9P9IYH0_9HYPO|nr:hypothetical protein B0J13DRAFT_677663 [Dactylonectria estremocensis]